jgi:NAD+ synthase (glutamine-hydrolysing)
MRADLQALISRFKKTRGFEVESYVAAKLRALNNFFRTQALDAVVLGISGGIDSAVALYLLDAAARQPDSPIKRIAAMGLPMYGVSGVSGQAEASNKAREVVEHIRHRNGSVITYDSINLATAYEAMVNGVGQTYRHQAWANGQMASVLRTPMFYFQAAILQTEGFRSLVAGTTNRDEGAYLGFFGKASDAMVDLQFIGDLHKSEVYQVGAYLGVPTRIMEATPQGDVWDERDDEQMIGAPYWAVELYLQMRTAGFDYAHELNFGSVEAYTTELGAESQATFNRYLQAMELLHNINAHKYQVGNPAHFVDVQERAVPGGWRA